MNIDKFWSRVSIPPDVMIGCWEWKGYRNVYGYGAYMSPNRVHNAAHRVAYEQVRGPIPDGLQIRHVVCRNKGCVNPMHMEVGTQQDNEDDKRRDGTTARGERVGTALLTAEQVLEIRARYATGEGQTAISRDYGVTNHCIFRIVKRHSWKHI